MLVIHPSCLDLHCIFLPTKDTPLKRIECGPLEPLLIALGHPLPLDFESVLQICILIQCTECPPEQLEPLPLSYRLYHHFLSFLFHQLGLEDPQEGIEQFVLPGLSQGGGLQFLMFVQLGLQSEVGEGETGESLQVVLPGECFKGGGPFGLEGREMPGFYGF